MIHRNAARFVAVALLGMLTACSTNPSTGRRQLILLPADQVQAMGIEAAPQLTQEYGGEVESKALQQYVSTVGQRLVRHVEPEFAALPWEFTTLDAEAINAFALPGGKVFVTRGLLQRFENEAQVAAVLGHEIGHVTGRHVDERLSTTMAAQYGLEWLGMATESELVSTGAGVAAQVGLLSFNRSQESESDLQGLKYMTRAGYDPRAMLQVLEVLAAAAEGNSGWEMLSTHPHPETRLEDVEELIRREYGFAVDSQDHQLYKSRFERDARPYLRP